MPRGSIIIPTTRAPAVERSTVRTVRSHMVLPAVAHMFVPVVDLFPVVLRVKSHILPVTVIHLTVIPVEHSMVHPVILDTGPVYAALVPIVQKDGIRGVVVLQDTKASIIMVTTIPIITRATITIM